MKRKWIDTNITILGLSKSGITSARYLSSKGANCTISEKREQKEEDLQIIKELETQGIKVEMGGHQEETILNSDVVLTSPGIPPHAEVIQLIKKNKIEMISEIELTYFETKKPFIAITGTNGKTTTTKLVSEILQQGGYNAPACGNIGVPTVTLLEDQNIDYFVAELSSFQIHTSPTFKPQIALFLNYTPDHIDWHGNEEEYFNAKAALFTGHKSPNWVILNACEPKILALKEETLSEVIYFGREMPGSAVYIQNNAIYTKYQGKLSKIIEIQDIPLLGKHNLQNVMGAIAIAMIVQVDNETIKQAIMGFKPPEHRLEFVATIDNIDFYNDSKATNCDSTICALDAFDDKKVVLIAGGRDKGTDLSGMVNSINEHTNAVVLIGEATDRFYEAISSSGYSNIKKANSLEEAIDIAAQLRLGPVLLSPACASFDMFKNYEERGKAFKNYVTGKKTVGTF